MGGPDTESVHVPAAGPALRHRPGGHPDADHFDHTTVNSILANKLPVTLELGILSLVITNLISIPLGLFCAARQDSISDYTIRVISTILIALPVFWIATLVLIYPNLWWGGRPR